MSFARMSLMVIIGFALRSLSASLWSAARSASRSCRAAAALRLLCAVATDDCATNRFTVPSSVRATCHEPCSCPSLRAIHPTSHGASTSRQVPTTTPSSSSVHIVSCGPLWPAGRVLLWTLNDGIGAPAHSRQWSTGRLLIAASCACADVARGHAPAPMVRRPQSPSRPARAGVPQVPGRFAAVHRLRCSPPTCVQAPCR